MLYLKGVFLYVLFASCISGLWRIYEIIVLGEIQTNAFDTIIAMILSLSLMFNVLLWQEIVKRNKEEKYNFRNKGDGDYEARN